MKKLLFIMLALMLVLGQLFSMGAPVVAEGGPKIGSILLPDEMPEWAEAGGKYQEALFIKTGPDCGNWQTSLTQVGFVQAWINDDNLYVRFYTGLVPPIAPLFDNEMLETHLKVALTLQELGKPTPGKFPYGEEYTEPRQDVVYQVPLESLGIDPEEPLPHVPLFIAGHAVVQGAGICQETAWSDCKHFPELRGGELVPDPDSPLGYLRCKKWAHYWRVDDISTLEWSPPS